MRTSIVTGLPSRRSARCCSHPRMLPRWMPVGSFFSRSRALCSRMRLGRCSRKATISLPSQPTFLSVPGFSADGADGLAEQVLAVPIGQLVARPRQRRGLAQPPHVVELEVDLDELSAVPAPRPRHRSDPRDVRLVERADAVAIDRRGQRVDVEAAQRVERGERSVDRQRAGAVDADRQVLFVLVLPAEQIAHHADANPHHRRRREDDRDDDPSLRARRSRTARVSR